MRFSELIRSAGLCPRRQRGEAAIEQVHCDSRRCAPGTCFVAIRGWRDDGHRHIAAALAAGAAAVVCQDDADLDPSVPCAVVDDSRRALGRLAQAVRGWPARRLTGAAVTGTKGKSTTAVLLREALAEAGLRAGLLGTICYQTGRRTLPAPVTTPDAVALAEMAAEMVADGCSHLVMEASSHALDQRRTEGFQFAVGVFTNLSGDHMDYHQSMDAYLAAKRRLFEELPADATAVLNRDEPCAEAMARATRARVVWFGLEGEAPGRPAPRAEFLGRIRRADYDGTDFELAYPGGRLELRTALMGRHNVSNCLAATAAAAAMGLEPARAARAVCAVRQVPGRMQRVPEQAPYRVFVDYSHTDDALDNALRSLRAVRDGGRIVVVFGCGGDRDRTKRPRMAQVAERLADGLVVTSDNPRTEDPQAIIREILAGLSPAARAAAEVEADRRRAIGRAIDGAGPGDVILIAGKGHETYQILGSRRVPFEDAEVAGQFIRRREGRT